MFHNLIAIEEHLSTQTMSGLLAAILLSVKILKLYNSLYSSLSKTGYGWCCRHCSVRGKPQRAQRLQSTAKVSVLWQSK